jgi:hypothetical protein
MDLSVLPNDWKEDFKKLSKDDQELLLSYLKNLMETDMDKYYSTILLYTPQSLIKELIDGIDQIDGLFSETEET